MIPLLFLFFFAMLLVVLANLGQRLIWARRLTFALLAVLAAGALLSGLLPFLSDTSLLADFAEPGIDFTSPGFGLWLMVSGGLSLVIMVAAVFQSYRHQDPALGPLYWSRPVQVTAVVLAILYAGFNLAFSTAITDPALLVELSAEAGVADVLGQYAIIVTLAFLGVGVGIRRTWRQTLARLGLRRIGIIELILVGSATLGMVFVSIIMGGVIMLLFPDSLADVESFNQGLLLTFGTPLGAIALGLFSGIGEEILYRGALQPAFGLVVTSLIFALHHSQYVNPGLLVIFVIGLLLGLIRRYWGTTPAIVVHALYNAVLLLLSIAAAQFISS
jgi:membrane protease YdiL (CAAX protease family)